MVSKKHIEIMSEQYKECLRLQREVISMDYTGNEFYQDTKNTNIPYTRHVASATWLQGLQTIDKSAEIKQALEMAKGNTFRLKKKVSTVTKIELLP